jgi:hypothetical protein
MTRTFALRTPADLLAKLRHDFGRLKANPADSYAAFDFFVTGLHIKDWLRVNGRKVEPTPGIESALWSVCCELGNGMKHFGPAHNDIRIDRTEHPRKS